MNAMNASPVVFRIGLLSTAIALAALPQCGLAQQMDHSKMNMSMLMPAEKKPQAKKPVPKKPAPKKPALKKKASKPDTATPAQMDHSKMDMAMPMPADAGQSAQSMDHSAMDHAVMEHDMDAMPMDSAMPGMTMAPADPITPIPVLTDADRAAAMAPAGGHTAHDNSIQDYTLIDRLEIWNADRGPDLAWSGQAWVGTDLNRLWLRSEGARIGNHVESASLELLYGRSISPWWDLVAGVRHDFKPGAAQNFAAIGVMGLAPYKFEVAATAYIGQSGQTAARLESSYETLLTNRLILQPLVEVNLYGKNDPQRGIGSGLGTVEAGLRLRYEFTRRFAPYIGIVRERAFGNTADLRRAGNESIDDTRVVAGLRIWF